MINIRDIDSNFAALDFAAKDAVFYNCFEEPFEINGLYKPRELKKFIRLPEEFADSEELCDGVKRLMGNTAGGRIRFATDSPYLCITVELSGILKSSNLSFAGASGTDIYIAPKGSDDYRYKCTVAPEGQHEDSDRFYGGSMEFENYDKAKEHEVMIHLPLYNGVNALYIGIKEGCSLYKPVEYKAGKKVAFYGASVTQGGCASRPGLNYPNHLSRWLKTDFINLGFSGSAKGEEEIAQFLTSCGADVLFLDLDMSENCMETFKNTHMRFYEYLRARNKDIPIIFMSFAKYPKLPQKPGSRFRDYQTSNKIILQTVAEAQRRGDENVWYIDGEGLFSDDIYDSCTVDFTHPNDIGFLLMAKGIYPLLKKIIEELP